MRSPAGWWRLPRAVGEFGRALRKSHIPLWASADPLARALSLTGWLREF